MQKKISTLPIDFTIHNIEVEQILDYKVVSYLSVHNNLRDACLSCDLEFEVTDDINAKFWVLQDEFNFYVVDRLCQLTNLSGGY